MTAAAELSKINRPGLGYPARLGELYDMREDKFLGVHLYTDAMMEDKIVKTNMSKTEFDVSFSNTFKDKAKKLNIEAELSLSILSGFITVEGSGTYLNDSVSNSQVKSFAMTYKLRCREERLLSAEIETPVPEVILQDYLAKGKATHFVSSIQYGGNLVVNANVKGSTEKDNETITGHLQAKMDKLKGLISAEGKGDVEIKNISNDLKDEFDFTVYGDIPPQEMPFNPEGIAKFMAEAPTRIGEGVPTRIILLPIPPSVMKLKSMVQKIDDEITNGLLETFSDLNDIRARFLALRAKGNNFRKFVPSLAITADGAVSKFNSDYAKQLLQLRECLLALKTGATPEKSSADVLSDALDLYTRHSTHVPYETPNYPNSLTALEDAFLDFERLFKSVIDCRGVFVLAKEALMSVNNGNVVPFIFLPALRHDHKADLIAYTAFVTTQLAAIPSASAIRVLYLEDRQALEKSFPGTFPTISDSNPQLYAAEVKDGELTWFHGDAARNAVFLAPGEPRPEFSVDLGRRIRRGYSDRVVTAFKVDGIDGSKSFSVVMEVEIPDHLPESSIFLILNREATMGSWDTYEPTFLFLVDHWRDRNRPQLGCWLPFRDLTARPASAVLPVNVPVRVVLVQDMESRKWYLYQDKEKVWEADIGQGDNTPDSKERPWKNLYIDASELARDNAVIHVRTLEFYAQVINPLA